MNRSIDNPLWFHFSQTPHPPLKSLSADSVKSIHQCTLLWQAQKQTTSPFVSACLKKSWWQTIIEQLEDEEKKKVGGLYDDWCDQLPWLGHSPSNLLYLGKKVYPTMMAHLEEATVELEQHHRQLSEPFYSNYAAYLRNYRALWETPQESLSERQKLARAIYARLWTYAEHSHTDMVWLLAKEIAPYTRDERVHALLEQNPSSSLTVQEFTQMHALVHTLDEDYAKRTLPQLPWMKPQKDTDFNLHWNGHDGYLLPSVLISFVPHHPPRLSMFFPNTVFRHQYFRSQFAKLAMLQHQLYQLRRCLDQKTYCFHDLENMISVLHSLETLQQKLLQEARTKQVKGFWGWFARRRNQMLSKWENTLTQLPLAHLRLEVANQIAAHTEHVLPELTAERHQHLNAFFDESANLLPAEQESIIALQKSYRNKTHFIKKFLDEWMADPPSLSDVQPKIAYLLRFYPSKEISDALHTLVDIIKGKGPASLEETVQVEKTLQTLFERAAYCENEVELFYQNLARHHVLPHLENADDGRFAALLRWDKMEAERYWQAQQGWFEDILSMASTVLETLSPEQIHVLTPKTSIEAKHVSKTLSFSLESLLGHLAVFEEKTAHYPKYRELLQSMFNTYVKQFQGENRILWPLFQYASKEAQTCYLEQRLLYLVKQETPWEEELKTYQWPQNSRYPAWCTLLKDYGYRHSAYQASWHQALISFQHLPTLQAYQYHSLKLWLIHPQNSLDKNQFPLELALCLGAHEQSLLEFIEKEWLLGTVELSHLQQVYAWVKTWRMDKVCHTRLLQQLEEKISYGQCQNELQAMKEKSKALLEEGQYESIQQHCLSLFRQWQRHSAPQFKELYRLAYQEEMMQLANHVRGYIQHYDLDTPHKIKARCIDKLPEIENTFPDVAYLKLLCDRCHLYYVFYYDADCQQSKEDLCAYINRILKEEDILRWEGVELLATFCRFSHREPHTLSEDERSQLQKLHERLLAQWNECYRAFFEKGQAYQRAHLTRTLLLTSYFNLYASHDKKIQKQVHQLTHGHLLQYVLNRFSTGRKKASRPIQQFLEKIDHPHREAILALNTRPLTAIDLQRFVQWWWAHFSEQLEDRGFSFNLSRKSDFFQSASASENIAEACRAIQEANTFSVRLEKIKTMMDTLRCFTQTQEGEKLQSLLHPEGLWIKLWEAFYTEAQLLHQTKETCYASKQ